MSTSPVRQAHETADDQALHAPLFAIRGRSVTAAQVYAAAEFLGLLQDPIDLFAAADSHHAEIPADTLHEALTDLRYHFNLITAEETEAWLAEHQLTLDDLQLHLEEQLRAAEPAARAGKLHLDAASLASRLWRHLTLSDAWPELLRPIIRRYLVDYLQLNSETFNESHLDAAREDYCQRQRISLAELPRHLATTAYLQHDYDHHLRREALYRQYSQSIASTADCRRQLSALRPRLYRVDFEAATFLDYDIAREAHLCVQLDGEILETVAERAQADYNRLTAFIEDLSDDIGRYLLSAQPGELIKPVPCEGRYCLLYLRHKHDPTLSDPDVHQRIRRHLVDNAFAPHLQRDIQWPQWQLMPTS